MTKHIKTLVKSGLKNLGLRVSLIKKLPVGFDVCLDFERRVLSGRIETIFDVGANIGQTAQLFADCFPGSRIFCFEPVASTYRQLSALTGRRLNIRCIHAALGASDETGRLYHQTDSQWNSLAENVDPLKKTGTHEDVTVTTLDGFCAREGIAGIDLLKTDTEGFDLEVLRGATKLLGSGKVLFVYSEVTFDESDHTHTNFFGLAEFLKTFNFRFVSLYDQVTRPSLMGSYFSNALFVNPEARTK